MKITINVPDDDQGVEVVESIAQHSGVIVGISDHAAPVPIIVYATVTTIELEDK